MHFTALALAFTGLTLTLAQTYDDGQYHPYPSTTAYRTSSTTAYYTPPTTAYYNPTHTPSSSTWYYWPSNSTMVYSSSSSYKPTSSAPYSTATYMPSNMTHTNTSYIIPYNGTMTRTSIAPVYTTTVCDFQSSCYTTLATATSRGGPMGTDMAMPTMTPYSSSDRLIASGWAALLLCGIAMMF